MNRVKKHMGDLSLLATLALMAPTVGLASEKTPSAQNKQTPAQETTKTEQINVIGSRRAYYTEITQNSEKLLQMPGAMGDPVAAISALPGVILPANGSQPAVRGSSPNDNKYFIDGMPAGYIFHQFNTSIFDPSTIQDFQLYSAGFGAQYSSATGAVIDVRLRDPKNQAVRTKVDASFLRAGIFIEGGITDNSAFYLSARKGLLEFFIPEDDEADEDGVRIISAPQDSDYLAKYVWNINSNHQLQISAIGASDYAEAELDERSDFAATNPDFAGDAKIDDGFNSQSIQWHYQGKSSEQLEVILARYQDKEKTTWGDGYFQISDLTTGYFKSQYSWRATQNHSLQSGLEITDTKFEYDLYAVQFVCTEFDVDCQSSRRDTVRLTHQLNATDVTLYLIDHWQISQNFNLESGLQAYYSEYTDEVLLMPRLASEWYFSKDHALTLSAGQYARFPDIGTVIPEIGNPELDSYTSNHYTLGFKGQLDAYWNWSIEGYYKTLDKLPAALAEENDPEQVFYQAAVTGKARGVDLFINRDLHNDWYGWISLSYSNSSRTNTLTGKTSRYHLDTPLVINLVGHYQFNSKWDFGFRFIAKSGEASTEIIGIQENPSFPDLYIAQYGEPFAERLPVYARLDLKFKRSITMFGNPAEFYIDIINALNRKNVLERDLDYQRVNQSGQLFIEEDQDMGIFPSVGISFSF